MSTSLNVVVVSAGLSQPSTTALLADELTLATHRSAAARGSEPGGIGSTIDVTRIELREHAHAITDALLTGFATGSLRDALDTLATADAVIVVTPTYQASYSGLLKLFVDLLEDGVLRGTPVLVAATGGTERHSLVLDFAMRPLFAHLGAVVVPTGVYAATGDFGGRYATQIVDRADRAARELLDAAHSSPARRPRPRGAVSDSFADLVPFEQLLAQR